MKKTFILIIFLVIGFSTTLKSQVGGNKEKQFVAKFLSYMHMERGTNYPAMMDCISPSYMQENKLEKSNYKVNNYSIWGFTIESYSDSNRVVTAKVYGEKRSWAHRLTFNVVEENGKLYIQPGSHDEQWIHPWLTSDSNVK